jgi:hypothetical protein
MSFSEIQSVRPNANKDAITQDDVFYCRPRRRRLELGKCLDDYMNANAFQVRRSACWRCPQGSHNRKTYAAAP